MQEIRNQGSGNGDKRDQKTEISDQALMIKEIRKQRSVIRNRR
jgi:hypothetical protein